MITYQIKQIHNLTRPGQDPIVGDEIHVETSGGFVRRVDPKTRECAAERQTFRLIDDGGLAIVRKPVNIGGFTLPADWRQ